MPRYIFLSRPVVSISISAGVSAWLKLLRYYNYIHLQRTSPVSSIPMTAISSLHGDSAGHAGFSDSPLLCARCTVHGPQHQERADSCPSLWYFLNDVWLSILRRIFWNKPTPTINNTQDFLFHQHQHTNPGPLIKAPPSLRLDRPPLIGPIDSAIMPLPGNSHHCLVCHNAGGGGRASKSHSGDCCPKHEMICTGEHGLLHPRFIVTRPEYSLNGKKSCEQCKKTRQGMEAREKAQREKEEKSRAKASSKKEFLQTDPGKERGKARHRLSPQEEDERRMKEREYRRRQSREQEQKRYAASKGARKENEAFGMVQPARSPSPYRKSRRSGAQMPPSEDVYGPSRVRSPSPDRRHMTMPSTTRQPSAARQDRYDPATMRRPSRPSAASGYALPTTRTKSPPRMANNRSSRGFSPTRPAQPTATGPSPSPWRTVPSARPPRSPRRVSTAEFPPLATTTRPLSRGRTTALPPLHVFDDQEAGQPLYGQTQFVDYRARSPPRNASPPRGRRDVYSTPDSRPSSPGRLYSPPRTSIYDNSNRQTRRQSLGQNAAPVRDGRDFYSLGEQRFVSQDGFDQYGQGGYDGYITHGSYGLPPPLRQPSPDNDYGSRRRSPPKLKRYDSAYDNSYFR